MHNFFRTSVFINTLFILVVVVLLVFFHFRGITYYDEGYILNAALRTIHGEIPYKDFHMVYTPVSFLYTSVILQLFGESVFSGRVAALSLSVASIIALYLLLRLFTQSRLIITGTVLFFISWGPIHINFPWPTMFALCFLLYSAYLYLTGVIKNSRKFFFFAGVATALVFLSKQNFGAGTVVVFLLVFPFLNLENIKKHFISYLLGMLSIIAGYILFLLFTSSFLPFIENMYLYTLKRVFMDKTIETPFLYEGALFIRFVKTIFYTLPLLLAIASLKIIPKSKSILAILPILTGMFYLLGIRPTTDYVHVVSLLALASIPLALVVVHTRVRAIKYLTALLLVSLTLLGFYTAYFKGYYQWQPSLSETTRFVPHERLGIFLTAQDASHTIKLIEYIKLHTKPEDYIFVNAYEPMVYFLSARRNPTPHDLVSVNQLPLMYQQSIIKELQEKDVKLVLFHELHENEKSIVADYIRNEYRKTNTIGSFILFEK